MGDILTVATDSKPAYINLIKKIIPTATHKQYLSRKKVSSKD